MDTIDEEGYNDDAVLPTLSDKAAVLVQQVEQVMPQRDRATLEWMSCSPCLALFDCLLHVTVSWRLRCITRSCCRLLLPPVLPRTDSTWSPS